MGSHMEQDCCIHSDMVSTFIRRPSRIMILILSLAIVMVLAMASSSLASNGDGPPLTVTSPVDGEHTNNATLVIQGSTAPDAMVSITASATGPSGAQSYILTPEANGSFVKEFNVIEGLWYINVTVSDGSGHNTSVTMYVVVDRTPPRLEVYHPTESPTYTQYRYASITGYYDKDPNNIANEDRGVFVRQVELVEGDNHIDIRFMDEAGNEAVEWVYIIADWTPPTVIIEKPWPDPYVTNNSTVRFSGRAGTGAVEVLLEHKGVSVPVTILKGDLDICATWEYILELGPADLEQDIIVKAIDHVGNEALDTVRVIYDIVPPSFMIDEFPMYSDSSFLWVNGTTDKDIGMVFIDDHAYAVVNGVFMVQWVLNKGRNEFVVSVRDEAGNEASQTFEAWYGTDPPRLKMDVPDRTDSDTVKIKGTTDTDVDTVSINGAKYPVVDGRFAVEVNLTEGANKFLVEVLDSEGHKASRTVVVEYSTPGFGAAMVVAVLAVASALITTRRSRR